jgi:hypothetical protein
MWTIDNWLLFEVAVTLTSDSNLTFNLTLNSLCNKMEHNGFLQDNIIAGCLTYRMFKNIPLHSRSNLLGTCLLFGMLPFFLTFSACPGGRLYSIFQCEWNQVLFTSFKYQLRNQVYKGLFIYIMRELLTFWNCY